MKKIIFLLTSIICLCGVLAGCSSSNDITNDEQVTPNNASNTEESSLIDNGSGTEENFLIDNGSDVESESQTEESNAVNADELEDKFGIPISLPENTNWIVNREYHLIDENSLEITYYDSIADADCVILVAKNENLALPENEYDETLDESWTGKTINGHNIVVKVQHGKNDSKTVLVTWEYNEYQFAIIGEVENSSDSIPPVALNIINNLN